MLRHTAASFAGALLILTAGSGALAQSPTPSGTTTTPPAPSPYESLSPGNQKIVRALFEAQTTATTPTGTTGTSTAPKTLTLDEIAAMKQSGQGWGNVFKDMKAQGLVQDKNLGQVVSGYNHRRPSHGSVTTASGREYRYEDRERGWRRHVDDGDRASSTRHEPRHEARGEHGAKGEPGYRGEHGSRGESRGDWTSGARGSGRSEYRHEYRYGGGHGSRGSTYTAGGRGGAVDAGRPSSRSGSSGHGRGGHK